MKKIKFLILLFCKITLIGSAQNVGIGTNNPQFKLDVNGRLRIMSSDINNSAGLWLNNIANDATPAFIGMRSDSLIGFFGSNSSWKLLMNTKTGNLSLGDFNPTRPLSFPATLEKKISLYPGTTGDAGFGVFGNEMRIHSDNGNADITLGFDDYQNGFTERMRIKGNGNVGIGVNPLAKLDVNGQVNFRGTNNISHFNIGTNEDTYIRGGKNGSQVFINELSGAGNVIIGSNVGIGTTAPGFPLNFPNTVGDKISLFGNSGAHYGFGVQGSLLQIHSAGIGDDVAFGYGSSSAFTERMRIKGNGNIGIGNSDPSYKLDINGRMRIRADGNTAGIWFNNSSNTQLRGFFGMQNEDNIGIFGDAGALWALTVSTSSGNIQASNNVSINGTTNINGFTKLGELSPAIKTKLITGTTSVAPAGFVDIPHGLDRTKIIGISILVTTIDGVDVGPGYFVTTGLQYNFQMNANNVKITNPILPIDCALILFRPVRILLTYQE
jgi:hypothetical protein